MVDVQPQPKVENLEEKTDDVQTLERGVERQY